jgi:hypothetical protein
MYLPLGSVVVLVLWVWLLGVSVMNQQGPRPWVDVLTGRPQQKLKRVK